MTVPLRALVAFGGWTVPATVLGVGLRRWSRFLTGPAKIVGFSADALHGSPAYRRAMRAHARRLENPPVYAAVTAEAAGAVGPLSNTLALAFMAAGIAPTSVQLRLRETVAAVGARFGLFGVRFLWAVWTGIEALRSAVWPSGSRPVRPASAAGITALPVRCGRSLFDNR